MQIVPEIKTQWHLTDLLRGVVDVPSSIERNINGLSLDSRHVRHGDLFLACAADKKFRTKHIEQALESGAAAVVYLAASKQDKIREEQHNANTVPIIPVCGLRKKLGHIAARFYGNPSDLMTVVGITGTNGKTSCSQFLAMSLQSANKACGIIGTLGTGFPDSLQPGIHTTPDQVKLQQTLAGFQQQGADSIAMEVSSHGLDQDRVEGVNFDVAVFTNLTRDHLDYHGNMENYAKAKSRLFQQPGLDYAVINLDDKFGQALAKKLHKQLPVYGYTIDDAQSELPLVRAHDIRLNGRGFTAKVTSPWGDGVLRSSLLGRFNVSNVLAVLATMGVMGITFDEALSALAAVKTVPGRMEAFGRGKQPLVVVDYSHTPDSLEQALIALREHCQGKLWCVFGCGGDRDRGKRPLMGEIAERYSDQIIITDDNPRHEAPDVITDEIVKGLLCPWAAEIEHDRAAAIAHAIDCADSPDIVLIAGKGHEAFQQIGDEKLLFSDAEQVKLNLKRKVEQ